MFRLEPTPEQKAFAKHFESLPTYTLEEMEALTTTENKAISAEPEPEPEHLPLMLNDGNFAKAIEARHGENIRYVHDVKKPFLWKRTHFQPDTTDGIFSIPRNMIEQYEKHHRAGVIDEKTASVIARHVKEYSRIERQQMVLKQLYTFPFIGTTSDCFDNDPHKLNTLGGTYTFRFDEPDYYDFKPHSRNDLITHCAPVKEGKPDQCKTWLSFLNTIFASDSEMIGFIKRFCGYLLEGGNKAQKLFITYGTGGNGKTVFNKIISAMFGTYAHNLMISAIIEKKFDGMRNDLAALRGKRFVTIDDTGDKPFRFDSALVKSLTGGDTFQARRLYENELTISPQFSFVIATNAKPIFNGADGGMQRRLILIPFEVTIPEKERNPNLHNELLSELNHILAWSLEGYAEYREQGLNPPQKVLLATQELCNENDQMQQFIDDNCEANPEKSTLFKDFREAFNLEMAEAGTREWNRTKISNTLKAKGFAVVSGSKNKRIVKGLALKGNDDFWG